MRRETARDYQRDVVSRPGAECPGGERAHGLKGSLGGIQYCADGLIIDHIGESVAAEEQRLPGCKRRINGDV